MKNVLDRDEVERVLGFMAHVVHGVTISGFTRVCDLSSTTSTCWSMPLPFEEGTPYNGSLPFELKTQKPWM